MNLFFPDNIFTRVLTDNLSAEVKKDVKFIPSAILAKKLIEEPDSVALIPSLELITYKDLFVSKSIGISFDGSLCNSFIYYKEGQEEIKDINIAGDVSSMEVILCKILFKELYNVDVEINIQTKLNTNTPGNYLIVGDENFNNTRYKNGISISEEITEIISAPFVNFILASKNKDVLEDYSSKLNTVAENINYEKENILKNLDQQSSDFIKGNFKSIVFNLDEQDNAGLSELIQLPYFYGMLDDIFEINFV